MISTLFLQSELEDPYSFYETMLQQNPVYYDNGNKTWAVYSYKDCRALLGNSSMLVPPANPPGDDGLNNVALWVKKKMARLSNGTGHQVAREITMRLFEQMKPPDTRLLTRMLIENGIDNGRLDWVEAVAKKLQALSVLQRFAFNDTDRVVIADSIEQLNKIMWPQKKGHEIVAINTVIDDLYVRVEKKIQNSDYYRPLIQSVSEKFNLPKDDVSLLCISNLISLIIQGYDAGRGLLSNALLQIINNCHSIPMDTGTTINIAKCITETLRYDPPVQNTRRVAAEDIIVNNNKIISGEPICIMLAAANRDPHIFDEPGIFNIERGNNALHLTFGAGIHGCPANYLSIAMTTEAISYLLETYPGVRVVEKDINYEPLVNQRLPKHIFISLT
jgi:cytochrome P450